MGVKLAAAAGGSVELVPANTASNYTITMPASTGTVVTTTSPKVGNVLQVVSSLKTDTWTSTSATWTNITGLTASITPSSTSSKILVLASVAVGLNGNYFCQIRLARNGTGIGIGDAAGVRIQTGGMIYMYNQLTTGSTNSQITWPGMVLDSPSSTSAITYSVQMEQIDSQSMYINRLSRDADASYEPRSASTITLMEIAG